MNPPRACVLVAGGREWGGAEASLLELARGLAGRGLAVRLVLDDRSGLALRARECGLDVVAAGVPRVGRRNELLGPLWRGRVAAAAARALDGLPVPRIVHANGPWWLPALREERLGARVTVHVRDRPRASWRARLERAHRVMAVSRWVAGQLPPGVEAAVVPPGPAPLCPSRDVAATRRALGVGTAEALVLVPGRLVPWKRQDLAIAGFAAAGAAGVLAVAGSDRGPGAASWRRRLAGLARGAGVARRVRFLGHRDDLADLLAAADLVVFPAVEEPFGRGLVEAAGLRAPLLAAAGGGHLEILGREGEDCLVQRAEPTVWGGRIREALARGAGPGGGPGALAGRVKREFSPARAVDRFLAALGDPGI